MDFRFTAEQEAFREEVRAFLREELPPDWEGAAYGEGEGVLELSRRMTQKLAERR